MVVAINKVFNYARMTTATAGTGTVTLGTAVAPYLTFAQAGVADADVVYYSIVDGTSNVECGIGTYTAAGTTLSRTTVLRSSGAANTGKITLSGAAEVHVEFLADGVAGNIAVTAGQIVGTATNDDANAGNVGEYVSVVAPTNNATVTMTIASPCVVTWTTIPYSGNGTWTAPIKFTTTGALPTGVVASTQYWVIGTSVSGNTFQIATSVANAIAGTAINTSGAQSGIQTGTSAITLVTNTSATVAAFVLGAGNWLMSGISLFGPGATTSITDLYSSLSTTLDTGDNTSGRWAQSSMAAVIPAGAGQSVVLPNRVVKLTSNTTFHLIDFGTFTVSTLAGYGQAFATRFR